ncbi:MAG: chorismate mutase [bacterium]|nr:chorismate mutase [bacterium]
MHKKDRKLDELRAQIESVDMAILKSLSKRVGLVRAVGEHKRSHGIEFLDKNRRDALLLTWIAVGKSLKLPEKLVRDVFSIVHRHSLSIEKGPKEN